MACAEKRAEAFKVRNPWNDYVMTEYCRAVEEYHDSTTVRDYQKYAAAFARSNCRLYIDLADTERPSRSEPEKQ